MQTIVPGIKEPQYASLLLNKSRPPIKCTQTQNTRLLTTAYTYNITIHNGVETGDEGLYYL